MKINIDLKGGTVVYDEFDLDLNTSLDDQIFELQEDLIQVKYGNNYILDLGWQPALDPKGYFMIHIIKNSNWDEPIYKKSFQPKNFLYELKNAVDLAYSLAGE